MKTRAALSFVLLGLGFQAALPLSAHAADRMVTRVKDWSVYEGEGAEGRVCYAATRAMETSPSDIDHGEPYLILTRFTAHPGLEQPSFSGDLPLKPDGEARLRTGDLSLALAPAGMDAFLRQASDEKTLILALRQGADARVEAEAASGAHLVYRFSLAGMSEAFAAASRQCGLSAAGANTRAKTPARGSGHRANHRPARRTPGHHPKIKGRQR